MLVISAGMQKSGSGLFFNLTNDLLVAAGGSDVREIKQKFGLEQLLQHYNCNLGELEEVKLERLLKISAKGFDFVVKTHSSPPVFLKKYLATGAVKVTCSYRDPRDVLLSALDHGARIRAKGESHSFAGMFDVKSGAKTVASWFDAYLEWLDLESDNLFIVDYDILLAEPIACLSELCGFLEIDLSLEVIQRIYSRYEGGKLNERQKDYLHFNEGKPGRFKSVFTVAERAFCTEVFKIHLGKIADFEKGLYRVSEASQPLE